MLSKALYQFLPFLAQNGRQGVRLEEIIRVMKASRPTIFRLRTFCEEYFGTRIECRRRHGAYTYILRKWGEALNGRGVLKRAQRGPGPTKVSSQRRIHRVSRSGSGLKVQ